jgi:hypothetical protein
VQTVEDWLAFCISRKVIHLLRRSVMMFIIQSVRKTSLDAKVLQRPSSGDQFTDTSAPHQKVSKKQVVTMAPTVNPVTI